MKDELVAYVCPHCGRHLVDAPRGASVSCPDCHVWAKTEPVRRTPTGQHAHLRASARDPA